MPLSHERVTDMHRKFGICYEGAPRHLSVEERRFRETCMQEELDEYYLAQTLEDQFDALLDLLVFTIGTMQRQGFPIAAGFDRVMDANMKKQLANSASASKRNFEIDLVKPIGWKAPDLSDLVAGASCTSV